MKKNYKILPFNQFDKNFLLVFLSSGALIGFLPLCPGTFGSLAGLFFFWFLRNFSLIHKLLIILGITIAGIVSSVFVSKLLKEKDPEFIVIDEFVGIGIAVIGKSTLIEFILAFVIFRIIDILKPYPIKESEKLPHGWGIMTDDMIGGFLTNVFVTLIIHIAKLLTLL